MIPTGTDEASMLSVILLLLLLSILKDLRDLFLPVTGLVLLFASVGYFQEWNILAGLVSACVGLSLLAIQKQKA